MSEKKQFEDSIASLQFSLLISGIAKTKNIQCSKTLDSFFEKYLYYFNFFALFSVVGGEISWLIHGIYVGESFIELSYILPLIVISILSFFKSLSLFFNKEKVLFLLGKLKEIHPEYNEDEGEELAEQINILNGTVKVLKKSATMLKVISTSVLIMFLLSPILTVFIKYLETGEFVVVYPFTVFYWFDVYSSDFWPLLYLHQVYATVICSYTLFATETLFYVLCSYIEMHFRILGTKFANIKTEDREKVREEMSQAVRRQQLLICITETGNEVYTNSSLVHIVFSSFLICLSAFNVSMATDINVLFAFITFLILSLIHVSSICFFGDKLMESSIAMSTAVYKCPWYDFDKSSKRDVLIILLRSRKPCKFTASYFADLNLRTFTTILSRSWSYFALLKTIYK